MPLRGSPAGSPVTARATVVIVTRDRREQLLSTLGRLQDTSGDPPVIVVDNASSDGSPEAVRRHFPTADVVRSARNLGAVGRTLGVRRATTRWVAFSDDDSWWGPGALDRATDCFEAHPRLALLAARLLVGPAEHLDPVCLLMAASPLPRHDDLPGPSVLGFLACGSVVHRQAYLDVGGFSPILHFLGEEGMLAQDLAAGGWGLAYVDDVVAHHHPRPGVERAGRRRLLARNALLSSWLRRPLPIVLRDTTRVLRSGADPELRGALLDATSQLPAVLRHRQLLPPWVERDLRLLEDS